MCLIVFSYKNHPRYDLIFAANRDEFYGRPTRAAQFWDEHPQLLAGKDLKSGGSWMGINRKGQIAALTNFRDPNITIENPPTRGEIVSNYLTQKKDSPSFLKELQQNGRQYMGFNVLLGSPQKMYHYSNQEQKINPIQPGVHGLSNHLLDTPWPKVERAKSSLEAATKLSEVNEETLFKILKSDTKASKDELPNTGIPQELEQQISPIFIQTQNYGTRSSTILLIDKKGNVTFEERRYLKGTDTIDETNRFTFAIESG